MPTKSTTISIDGATLDHINLLRAKVHLKFSAIVQYGLLLFLREVGYKSEDLSNPAKLLSILTKMKCLIDCSNYSEAEVLQMIKTKKYVVRRPTDAQRAAEHELISRCMDNSINQLLEQEPKNESNI